MKENSAINIRVGHWTDIEAATGCTVLLCPDGTTAAVDIRGGAPGTQETDLLRPGNLVGQLNAILLGGGSAFGLAATAGVMRYLKENGVGFPTVGGRVPIVSAAVIHDLAIGHCDRQPGPAEGYAACQAAYDRNQEEGSVGAGTGATVGKALGISHAVKGGLGIASESLCSGVIISAIMVTNCLGEIIDPATGITVAGPRNSKNSFISTLDLMQKNKATYLSEGFANSTIGAVITNATLSSEQCQRLAIMAQTGLTRAIRPAHTQLDGDTIFALATGKDQNDVDLTAIGALAAQAVEQAIIRSVRKATKVDDIPAARDLG